MNVCSHKIIAGVRVKQNESFIKWHISSPRYHLYLNLKRYFVKISRSLSRKVNPCIIEHHSPNSSTSWRLSFISSVILTLCDCCVMQTQHCSALRFSFPPLNLNSTDNKWHLNPPRGSAASWHREVHWREWRDQCARACVRSSVWGRSTKPDAEVRFLHVSLACVWDEDTRTRGPGFTQYGSFKTSRKRHWDVTAFKTFSLGFRLIPLKEKNKKLVWGWFL